MLCQANQCRSPMMERILRHAVRERHGDAAEGWDISSAGLAAQVGEPMDPYAADTLLHLGISDGGFRRRQVTRELLENAELIITAERSQRSAAIRAVPQAAARTFTLFEFAALLRGVSLRAATSLPAAGPALVSVVAARRGQVYLRDRDLDLADPVGRSRRRFRACGRTIANSIGGWIDIVDLVPSGF